MHVLVFTICLVSGVFGSLETSLALGRSYGFGGGLIAFDYGFRTVRFAAGIDEAEAHAIANHLIDQYGLDGKTG